MFPTPTLTEYDLELFIQIISHEGATCGEEWEHDGAIVKTFLGTSGKSVFIDMNEEIIPARIAIAYLKQLGYDYLILRLFPVEPISADDPDIIPGGTEE